MASQPKYYYFSGAANTLDLGNGLYDVLTFVGAVGDDTIVNFKNGETLQLSSAQFGDFHAFQNAFTQNGDDAVLMLDANDKVTFLNLKTSNVAASQVTFV